MFEIDWKVFRISSIESADFHEDTTKSENSSQDLREKQSHLEKHANHFKNIKAGLENNPFGKASPSMNNIL